ncbi:MAG: NHLP leader peptide family RiPP precursor [Actinomycetota bacterium]|nr:NHLP leader peptide family RiPP precursor [Actinomycetota bacterium]
MAQEDEQAKAYGRVVARAWQDEDFKGRLLADAEGALAEMGIEVPAGKEVRVVEDTERVRHLVIPPSSGEELSDEQLDQVAGGQFLSRGSLKGLDMERRHGRAEITDL